MITTIDRTDEKITLATELGLEEWANQQRTAQQKQRTMAALTTLHFTVTSEAIVRKKLTKFGWQALPHINGTIPIYKNWASFLAMFLSIGFWLVEVGYGVTTGHWTWSWTLSWLVGGVFILTAGVPCLFGFGYCHVKRLPLKRWHEELPYGALLALHEAKTMGIDEFAVFFPVRRQRNIRLPHDPIIVGSKDGVMVEIFHWDNHTLYD